MSYKFMSTKTGHAHDEKQWVGRSIDGELAAFEGRTLIKAIDSYLPAPNSRVLEAGCGLGAWCEWFRRRGDNVVGLEYFDEIVKKAKSMMPDIPVELGDVTNIRYDDNTFDAYISLGVIEHFEDGPEPALAEAFRVLKPDGLAFITVPVLTPIRRLISHPIRSLYFLIYKLQGKATYFWEYRYTRDELMAYVEQAGFEVLFDGVDDYEDDINDKHMGIWADWFFLRDKNSDIWGLNSFGRVILRILKLLPSSWYCAGWLVIARAKK